MDGKIPDQPGMKLNEIQIQETKAKFLKHERIVEVMRRRGAPRPEPPR